MSSLIHAIITVSGDESLLEACDRRIKQLLSPQPLEGEITGHHGGRVLCYDLKVKGGIPFPAFVEASQEFPALKMVAEWVNVDAGERGAATVIEGKLAAHEVSKLEPTIRGARPVYISVAGDGRLELALTCFRSNRDEWLGYALTADRDALLRVVRAPESDGVEIFATEGGEEWSLRWRSSITQPESGFEVMASPQPIDRVLYRELEQMARAFVAEWIWFAAGAEEETAIERDRFARRAYVVRDANVRSACLHRMRQTSLQSEGALEFDTFGDGEAWLKDVVARTWLKNGAT